MSEILNLDDTTPAAPANSRNTKWQKGSSPAGTDPTTGNPYFDTSSYMTDMVGDTGSGGADGLVPAPPAGSAAAGKYLKADGTFQIPPGGGGSGFVQEIPSGTMNGINKVFTLSFAPSPAASLQDMLNGVLQVPSVDITVVGATITYTVAPVAADNMLATYTH